MSGFHQDAAGEWAAELDCLHAQHVRHHRRSARPRGVDGEQRRQRLGQALDCPLV